MKKKGQLFSPLLYCIILPLFMVFNSSAQQLAFTEAQGWAVYTPGGRGGEIIRVTNLNTDGFGSFAQAVARNGKRIVVFEVGGVIDLKGSDIVITEPYLTIAGQTAPSPGITLINGSCCINSHDIIIRHICVRPGAKGHLKGWEPDALSTSKSSNVIIDHCSFTWAVDENCTVSGPRFEGETPDDWRKNTSHTVTISNNIIAEALSNSTHKKGEHSKGTLLHDNVTKIAVLNNLYSGNVQRNPYFKGGTRGVVANNIIYNPGEVAIRYRIMPNEWGSHKYQTGKMAVINNIMKYGPSSEKPPLLIVGTGPCEVFMKGNIAKNIKGKNVTEFNGEKSKLVDTIPVWHKTIKLVKTASLKESIIQNVGARPWDRDRIDTRIINDMVNGTGKIIDCESEVGGLPNYQQTLAAFHESEWDLDFMVKISPQISLSKPAIGNCLLIGSKLKTKLNIAGLKNKIEYAELFVNGVSRGKDFSSPYKWDIELQSLGGKTLLAIVKYLDGMENASEPVLIQIGSTTLKTGSIRSMFVPAKP